jgi:segregation and condensation protein B
MSEVEINQELKNIVEAALLVAGSPLTIDKILNMFPEDSRPERDDIKAVLAAIEEDYADRGIELKQIERGYRIQSREKYVEWLSRLTEEKPPRYSRAALETLAIIAYRQPVTRGDIEEIRGVSVSTDIIRQLLERDWVRQVGQRDVPGKPALYGTTRGFLEYFNLKSLTDLPTLSELRDLDEISKELNLPLDLDKKQEQEPDEQAANDDVTEEDEAEAKTTDSTTESEDSSDAGTEKPLLSAAPDQPR